MPMPKWLKNVGRVLTSDLAVDVAGKINPVAGVAVDMADGHLGKATKVDGYTSEDRARDTETNQLLKRLMAAIEAHERE